MSIHTLQTLCHCKPHATTRYIQTMHCSGKETFFIQTTPHFKFPNCTVIQDVHVAKATIIFGICLKNNWYKYWDEAIYNFINNVSIEWLISKGLGIQYNTSTYSLLLVSLLSLSLSFSIWVNRAAIFLRFLSHVSTSTSIRLVLRATWLVRSLKVLLRRNSLVCLSCRK